MGQAVAKAVAMAGDVRLGSVWLRDSTARERFDGASNALFSDDIDAVVAAADVLIDFSLPAATDAVLDAVTRHHKPLICGVSGLSDEQQASLDRAGHEVAVVYDRNMSLGVAILDSIARHVASNLGPDFRCQIHETHHVHKLDAPSGTALKLGDTVTAARGPDAAEISYKVERRGEVPGDHAVIFSSATETLTLKHSVTTRQVFADGALRAARWALQQPPGRYSMSDVLL